MYGEIEEDPYIEIPEGLTEEIVDKKVLKLNKSLNGLKQAPRSWNIKLGKTFQEIGLKQLQTDNCLFVNNNIMVAVYVDDMIVFGQSIDHILEFKNKISQRFKCLDLGQLSFVLGIRVEYKRDWSIILNQKQYIEKLIKKFDLENSKKLEIPIHPNHNLTSLLEKEKDNLRQLVDSNKYRQVIGSLIYLMTSTRPDISYSVGLLSRFMANPIELHWRC